MKICWDNLEKLKYSKKKNLWYNKGKYYRYVDSCSTCGEPFLVPKGTEGKYCTVKCCKTLKPSGGMPKLSLSFIKNEFLKEDYKLLTINYHNANQKLEFECPKEHKHSITWNAWRVGQRCRFCQINLGKLKEKFDFNFVKDSFESEGYILLSNCYTHNDKKLKFKCPQGHNYSISFHKWRMGQRCGQCSINKKLNIVYIKNEFLKENYTLLSQKYKNSSGKLKVRCPKGHIWNTTFAGWSIGRRCLTCSGKLKKSNESLSKELSKEGYKLISNYKSALEKFQFECPLGHKHSMRWNNWQQGQRCGICSPQVSKAEQEIYEFMKSLFPDSIHRTKSIISPLELDIFIPSKNLAIEYCGLYWHSENNGKDKNYHLNKLNMCNEKGIRLITIFEDEWLYKKDIVLSRLKQILNCSDSEVVYARNCILQETTQLIRTEFLNKFHIQGTDRSSIIYGAYYKDQLVSVMTFSKGSIAKGSKAKEGIWELSRFCSASDCRVIGIASKLLKYFINKFSPKEVYSYADRRWSDGNLYEKLGFNLEHYTQPNYWYINGNSRIHRFNFRKSVLPQKLDHFDSNLTEWENMKNNGYDRVWDCGNIKYSLIL